MSTTNLPRRMIEYRLRGGGSGISEEPAPGALYGSDRPRNPAGNFARKPCSGQSSPARGAGI